jgi:hypothetical protein
MKLYVIGRAAHVSDSYHEEGGIVVVAADLDAAKLLAASQPAVMLTDEEWAGAVEFTVRPVPPAPRVWPDWLVPSLLVAATLVGA